MPINAVCPECENRFALQDSLLGQSVRCPVCKKVFIVKLDSSKLTFETPPAETSPDPGTPSRPRSDAPSTNYKSGTVGDFVKVIGASSTKPTPTERKWSAEMDSPTREAQTALPSGPKEIQWTPDLDVDPKSTKQAESSLHTIDVDHHESELASARKPAKKSRKTLLVGLIAFTIGSVVLGGIFFKRYLDLAPERLYAAGKKEYDENHFDQARKLFEQINKDHPDHPRAIEARFFAPMAGLRSAVSSVLNKTEPSTAVGLWDQFLQTIADRSLAPFAEKNKFGIDIWQTGNRLTEDLIGKGNSVFNRDDPSESEKWLQEAIRITASMEQFRPDDLAISDGLKRDISELRAKIEGSRERAGSLKDLRAMLAEPDDEKLQLAKREATARGLDKDEGFLRIAGEAEQKIRAKAIYTAITPTIKPVPVTDDGLASLLFAPRLDRGPRVPVRGTPTTFFALARGVMYALDEADGRVLWAMRTGVDSHIPASRIPESEASPELAVIATVDGQQAGLHARHFRNGVSHWYQPLPSACLSQPVLIGAELYVPLCDAEGTVLEIVAITGEIKGKIQLGRPIGGPLSSRPGTSQLFIPAESGSVYAFDVDRRGVNGEHLNPALIGVIVTGHAPGGLLSAPFFANPEPENPGKRSLFVSVSTGLSSMMLRACPFTDGETGTVESVPDVNEISIPGWSRFPAYCDGEKIAIVTDQHDLMLVGIGLGGNQDVQLFSLPGGSSQTSTTRSNSSAQLVWADEVNYWVLSDKQLRQFRSGFTGRDGVRLNQVNKGLVLGEPVHAAQMNARKDMMVLFTHEGSNHFATAVDTVTGQMLWQRELGMLAKGEPVRKGNDLVWLDQEGGITKLDTRQLTQDSKPVWLVDIEDRWLLTNPAAGFRSSTSLMAGPNDISFTLMESEAVPKRFLIRSTDGVRVMEQLVPAPASLAGTPIVVGKFLVMPLENGTLYRVAIVDGKALEEGPTWRAGQINPAVVCHLTKIDGENFLATDGSKSVVRWFWAAENKRFEARGRLLLKDEIKNPIWAIPGTPNRFLILDKVGNLVLRDADLLEKPPIRVWRVAGKDASVPKNERLAVVKAIGNEKPTIVIVVGDQNGFAINLDEEKPIWKTSNFARPISGIASDSPTSCWITDIAGEVKRLDYKTGQISPAIFKTRGSVAVAGGAFPLDEKHLIVPLNDGTLLLGEWMQDGKPLAPGKP